MAFTRVFKGRGKTERGLEQLGNWVRLKGHSGICGNLGQREMTRAKIAVWTQCDFISLEGAFREGRFRGFGLFTFVWTRWICKEKRLEINREKGLFGIRVTRPNVENQIVTFLIQHKHFQIHSILEE